MKILILDDDDRRHADFDYHLAGEHELVHVYTYKSCIQEMLTFEYDIIFLDHDLNFEQYISKAPDGRELTGYDVTLFMTTMKNRPDQVIVHSHNMGGAIQMMGVLKGSGFQPIYWEQNPRQHPLQANGL